MLLKKCSRFQLPTPAMLCSLMLPIDKIVLCVPMIHARRYWSSQLVMLRVQSLLALRNVAPLETALDTESDVVGND